MAQRMKKKGKPEREERNEKDQVSRLEEMAQALYGIASGDFSVSLDTSPRQDELDTVAHGISMLAEELGSLEIERKNNEQALRDSEAKLNTLVGNVDDVIIATDLELNITYISPSSLRKTGFTAEEAIGRGIGEYITDESLRLVLGELAEQTARQLEANVDPPIHVIMEVEQYRKDGTTYPAEINAGFLRDPDGTPYGALAVSRDITERKRAEEELVLAKDFTENIIHSLVDTLILVDPQAGIKTVNRETCELLGYPEDELVGSPVSMILAEEEEEEEEEVSVFKGTRLTKLIEEGSIHNYDMTYLTKTGEEIPVSFSGSVMKDKDGELIGIVGIARDMREIKRLMQKEKELAAAERKRADELKQAEEEISRLSRRVMDEYEEARLKMAIDLHDDIGQSISAFKIEIDMMRKEAGDRLEDQAERLEGMAALLEDTLDKIRSISGELRPVLLDDFGLEKALGMYVEEFSKRTGVTAGVDCAGVPVDLEKNLELSLFRIAQEALVNVARHAGATRVRLSLLCEDGPLILTVDDNGNGFDVEKILHVDSTGSHFGILGMRERAAMVGGELIVSSIIGKGTTVVVKVTPP